MISSIRKLPNLEILKLEFLDFGGENWNTNDDEFFKVKYLKLRSLKLQNWNALTDHFPALERLMVKSCNFKRIPSELGLSEGKQVENGNEELKEIINGTIGNTSVI